MIALQIEAMGREWQPAYWRDLQGRATRAYARRLQWWANFLRDKAKERAPEGETGRIKRSIFARVMAAGDDIMVVIGVPDSVREALWVEFGTGVHGELPDSLHRPIEAKNARALRIPIGRVSHYHNLPAGAQAFVPGAGKVVAGTGVVFRFSQEGQKAQHFISGLLDEYRDRMIADLGDTYAREFALE